MTIKNYGKDMLNILIIGLGGAGQRHLRNTLKIFRPEDINVDVIRKTNKTPILNEDFSVNKNDNDFKSFFDINFVNEKEIISKKYNYIIVSTPTSLHTEFFEKIKNLNSYILIEKPLINDINNENLSLINEVFDKNRVLIGFQWRLSNQINSLFKLIKTEKYGKIRFCELTVSSFVPNWHKYENFKNLYACRSDLGGGVLLTECHELDMLIRLFGLPVSLSCNAVYNYIALDKNLETFSSIKLDYSDFPVFYTSNLFNPELSRKFKIYTDQAIISCDFINLSTIVYSSTADEILFSKLYDSEDLHLKYLKFFYEGKYDCTSEFNLSLKLNKLIKTARLSSLKNGNLIKLENNNDFKI